MQYLKVLCPYMIRIYSEHLAIKAYASELLHLRLFMLCRASAVVILREVRSKRRNSHILQKIRCPMALLCCGVIERASSYPFPPGNFPKCARLLRCYGKVKARKSPGF